MAAAVDGADGVAHVKFADILRLAGDAGRWQWLVFLCTVVGAVLTAAHNMSSLFLAAVPQHRCQLPPGAEANLTVWLPLDNSTGRLSGCRRFAAAGGGATEPCARYVFSRDQYRTTIAADWALVCDRRWMLPTVQASYMLGVFCGAIGSGVVSDQFGRKRAVVISGVAFLVTSVATAFATSYGVFVALRFVTAMAGAGVFGCQFILCMELVGARWRALIGLAYQVPFSLGFMAMPAVAYLLRDWRELQLAISVPSALMLLYWWVLPESPRWLIMQDRADEALTVLKAAAARNRRSLPPDHVMHHMMADFRRGELGGAATRPRSALAGCAVAVCEPMQLVRTRRMRVISLASFFNWLVVGMIYYGVSFDSANLSSSPHLAIFLAGLVETPAVLLSVPLVNGVGRRPAVVGTHICTAVAILCILAVPARLAWPKLALGIAGKFTSSATFGILYLYSAELFPTRLRNVGLGASSMCARVGSMTAPYVVDLLSPVHWAIPSCVFGLFAVLAALAALAFPETNARRLPETVDDVESGRWQLESAPQPPALKDIDEHAF